MTLRKLREDITELLLARTRRVQLSIAFLKCAVLLFSAVGGWVSIELSTAATSTSHWPFVGKVSCALIFLVAMTLLIGDGDPTAELRKAHIALNKAEELELYRPNVDANLREISRLSYLFVSIQIMRSIIEQSLRQRVANCDLVIDLLFTMSKQPLPIAMNFDISDEWTICVYKAEQRVGAPDQLRCIAHNRAINCDLSTARMWSEGVGVAGISYANRREVIVPDLRADNLGNLFNVDQNQRSYDENRYRSFAVVPISLEPSAKPWGVVVATSSKPGHFSPHSEPGLKTAEAVRNLAGMIALAISGCEAVATGGAKKA
jgi:hypothetical protein